MLVELILLFFGTISFAQSEPSQLAQTKGDVFAILNVTETTDEQTLNTNYQELRRTYSSSAQDLTILDYAYNRAATIRGFIKLGDIVIGSLEYLTKMKYESSNDFHAIFWRFLKEDQRFELMTRLWNQSESEFIEGLRTLNFNPNIDPIEKFNSSVFGFSGTYFNPKLQPLLRRWVAFFAEHEKSNQIDIYRYFFREHLLSKSLFHRPYVKENHQELTHLFLAAAENQKDSELYPLVMDLADLANYKLVVNQAFGLQAVNIEGYIFYRDLRRWSEEILENIASRSNLAPYRRDLCRFITSIFKTRI